MSMPSRDLMSFWAIVFILPPDAVPAWAGGSREQRSSWSGRAVNPDALLTVKGTSVGYLFGSRAEGRARPDSDFDLLVIFDDSVPDELITHDAVYTPVCGSGIGCDVVPCRVSEVTEVLHDQTNPWRLAWRN